jgi:hypothetical protein
MVLPDSGLRWLNMFLVSKVKVGFFQGYFVESDLERILKISE